MLRKSVQRKHALKQGAEAQRANPEDRDALQPAKRADCSLGSRAKACAAIEMKPAVAGHLGKCMSPGELSTRATAPKSTARMMFQECFQSR
jgi:hypothetical protein